MDNSFWAARPLVAAVVILSLADGRAGWRDLGSRLSAVVDGSFRPSFGTSVALFALTAFLAGMRMIAGSSLGLDLGAGPLQAMSVRAAAMQFGYFGASALGGLGLILAGWSGLGTVLAILLLLSVGVTVGPRARAKVGAR